jgi:histone H3/H4
MEQDKEIVIEKSDKTKQASTSSKKETSKKSPSSDRKHTKDKDSKKEEHSNKKEDTSKKHQRSKKDEDKEKDKKKEKEVVSAPKAKQSKKNHNDAATAKEDVSATDKTEKRKHKKRTNTNTLLKEIAGGNMKKVDKLHKSVKLPRASGFSTYHKTQNKKRHSSIVPYTFFYRNAKDAITDANAKIKKQIEEDAIEDGEDKNDEDYNDDEDKKGDKKKKGNCNMRIEKSAVLIVQSAVNAIAGEYIKDLANIVHSKGRVTLRKHDIALLQSIHPLKYTNWRTLEERKAAVAKAE